MPAIQQRRGTAADLALANETPLAGQIYFETDTNRVKIGDGSRTYNALPYLSDSTSIADLDGLQAALDANAAAAAAAQSSTDGLSSQFAQHKSRHATTGTDPLSPADIGAAPDTVVSRVTANEGDILFAKLDITNLISITSGHATDISTLQSDVAGITPASIGAQPAGTYATLVGGTVPASQLPSYVDDVIEASALASFPTTGDTGKIYVDTGTNKTYRWSGSTYIEIASSPGSTDAVPEGSVNLYFTDARAQAALTSALSTKVDTTDSRLTDARTPLAHTHALADLQQSGAATNDVIAWSGTAWTATAGGGGSTTLAGLTDVNITTASAGQFVQYSGALSGWVNVTADTGMIAEGSNLYHTTARAEAAARGIVGTTANTLCAGDDARLSDARTPTAHTHAQSDITGLVSDLANKVDTSDARLSDARTPTAHTHSQSDITGLTTDLAAKADLSGATFTGSVTAGTGSAQSFYANDSGSTNWAKPNYSFVNDTDTGMYRSSGNTLGFSVDSHPMWTLAYAPSVNIEYAELRGNLLLTTGYELWIQSGKVGINNTAPTYDLDVAGTARITNLTDGTTTVSMTDVVEANHTHAQSDVTNLTTDLANKVDTNDARLSDARTPLAHTHAQSEVTNLVTDLSNKVDTTDARLSDARTPTAHTHAQSDITNLVTDLAGKASASHTHALADLSNFTEVGNLGPVIRTGSGQGPFYTDVSYATFANNISVGDLSNVSASSPSSGDVLKFNGSNWASSPGVASDTTQAGGGTAVNNIVVITQAAYTALSPKDANTIYFIT